MLDISFWPEVLILQSNCKYMGEEVGFLLRGSGRAERTVCAEHIE